MAAKSVVAALTLAAALAVTAGAQAQGDRKDDEVFKDVSKAVLSYSQFTIFDDVSAGISDGFVRLEGRVTMPYKKYDLAKRVARVAGVKQVDNRIGVLPVSQFDDELRYRVARAIYRNSAFWHYASMANPPIHIIVENGRIRLTGVVNNDVERMLARSIATSFLAFSVTSDLKTDREVSALLEHGGTT